MLLVRHLISNNIEIVVRLANLTGTPPVYLEGDYGQTYPPREKELMKLFREEKRLRNLVCIDNAEYFLQTNPHRYRKIAGVLDEDSIPLFNLEFGPNDLLVLGNEWDGLAPEIIEQCDLKVVIPQCSGRYQCNTIISAASA